MPPRIPAQAVQLRHLAPQVTARALGATTVTSSTVAPVNPVPGDLWIDQAANGQLNQWTGSQWNPLPVNAGSLTGENFNISAAGILYYSSSPPYTQFTFETGAQGWTAVEGANASPSMLEAHSGQSSLMLTGTSGTAWSAASPQIPCTSNIQVSASAFVFAAQPLAAVGLQLNWLNEAGTLLSTSSAATAALAEGEWTQFLFNAVSPTDTAFVTVTVQDNEAPTAGWQLWIDDTFVAGPLLQSESPAGGTDPLGNAVVALICSYQPGTPSFCTQFGNGFMSLLTAPTPAGPYGFTTGNIGFSTAQGFVAVELLGNVADIQGALSQPLVAVDPVDGAPTAETWHAMPAFATGFSHGTPAPMFKLNADNTVSFAGSVNVSSGTAGATFVTLPEDEYFPISNKSFPARYSLGTPPTSGNPQISISTTGAVGFSDVPTGAAFSFSLDNVRYPLDA